VTSRVLLGMRAAILVFDGFEYFELDEVKSALDNAGASTFIVSGSDTVTGWFHGHYGTEVAVGIPLQSARSQDFHALFLPGGTKVGEIAQNNPQAAQFVKDFIEAGKPVAAISEGPALITKAGTARGRIMTCSPALQGELESGGANWVNEAVVCDGNLITARSREVVPDFIRETIRSFAQVREHLTDMRKRA